MSINEIDVLNETENLSGLSTIIKYGILGLICLLAFSIRLFAVVRYESVIHEFDPYFNFRTTKYLAHEGFLEFLNWFDDRGWYPLGRTIGGTIYPGIMITAAIFYWFAHFFNITINIRNVCVFLAPIFSANASIASYLLTTEVTKKSGAGLLAAALTAIVPSYISRSVGGSYDNEGVAIFALIFTFYLWVKSVNTGSMLWSCLCALSYYYMVAAWGGYVFIINVIPIYMVVMILAGRYSNRLYVAYSIFYTLGSLMAMTVPFVGFNVINQAECAASHGVFIAIQIYALLNYGYKVLDAKIIKGIFVFVSVAIVLIVASGLIYLQIQGKLQWSGRSLTLLDPTYASKYIPIIASVSEHQPTPWTSFFFDLHVLVILAPAGLLALYSNLSDGSIFLIIYGTVAWYFAGVMVRLMLTLAPIACILGAIGASKVLEELGSQLKSNSLFHLDENVSKKDARYISPSFATIILAIITGIFALFNYHSTFAASIAYSSPSIVIDAGTARDGSRILFDDYREAYFWLRQNTPEDSKIFSWWDYGYQMSAMANRTVLVDNNTWNNTHIATIGRALASSEEEAYPIFESLDVDYVLVVFGGLVGYGSDDINKLLWPIRIANGVYGDNMPHESDFYSKSGQYDIGPNGSPTFLNSIAYKLSYYRFGEVKAHYSAPSGFDRARNKEVGVKNIKLETLEEAFTSEHWIIRIYKVKHRKAFESKLKGSKSSKKTKNSSSKSSSTTTSSTTTSSSSKTTKEPTSAKATQISDDDQYLDEEMTPSFVGCLPDSSLFSETIYKNNTKIGVSFTNAAYFALDNKFPYFALSRGSDQGDVVFFRGFTTEKVNLIDGADCERPCLDQTEAPCGCKKGFCKSPNESRWALYQISGLLD